MKWTAREICRQLYIQAFRGKHLIICPNTYWPGSETDLLIVRNDLRLMEVEIKISRSDLKADKHKDKWFDQWTWRSGQPWLPHELRPAPTPRTHPRRIWKHYYCMPEAVWKEGLEEDIPPTSGIILMRDHRYAVGCWLHRQAKPAKNPDRIAPEELADIARMQSHKMWEAFAEVDRVKRQKEQSATVSEGGDL